MNKKTIAIFVVCMLLVCGLTIVGTLAYITANSNQVVNTFTYGKITMTLRESLMDSDGIKTVEGKYFPDDKADAQTSNQYKIIPLQTYTKDPVITVEKDSEPCYVGATLTVTNSTTLGSTKKVTMETFLTDFDIQSRLGTGWSCVGYYKSGNDYVFSFVYANVVNALEEEQVLPNVFSGFKAPDFDNDDLKTLQEADPTVSLDVQGFAVQTTGFEGKTAEVALSTGFPTQFGSLTKLG